MKIRVVTGLRCPKCGCPEAHPTDEGKILIRGLKVHDQGSWWSQCLFCAGYYEWKNGNYVVVPNAEKVFNREKGWFRS